LKTTRERLDVLVCRHGLADSREQAQRLIRAGKVSVKYQVASKPGFRYAEDVPIVVQQAPRFVSRGGEKLDAALQHFRLRVAGLVCIDVGASTGGFTDCLLQHGAAQVTAVDVGKGQLHWNLRRDPRVIVVEGVNARYLEKADIPSTPAFAALDVSFISLTKVLPAVIRVLAPVADIVALIKPQFEAGREQVQKGGVVRDASVRKAVVAAIRTFGEESLGLRWIGICPSPLKGPAGNVEYLSYLRKEE